MQSAVGLRYMARPRGTGFWDDGVEALAGAAFASDRDSGVYRIGANEWGLTAGGVRAMRLGLDTLGTRVDFGNSVFPLVGFASGSVVTINHTTAVNNDGTIGLSSSLINNGVLGSGGTGAPDFSAATLSVFQTDNAAMGSMRSLEAHTVRMRSDAAAGTAMVAEMGMHTAKAGVAGFGTGATFPGTMGIWLPSYADSNMAGAGIAAVAADVALYISGQPGGGGAAGGWRYPIFVHDISNNVLFSLSDTGTILSAPNGNAAAPTWAFVGDSNTGVFRGGADVLAFSAGGVEHARLTSLAFQASTGLILDGVITPTQLAANTDNWNPTGLATATVIRASTDASRNLTGITAFSRRVLSLQNVGAQNLVLKHDVTSTAANRFYLPNNADLTLLPNQSVMLWYDDTSSRWRCLGGT